MMAALIKWRWAAVLCLWALSAGGAYVKGYLDAGRGTVVADFKAYQNEVEHHETIDRNISKKSVPNLDRALLNWVQPD